MFAKKTLNFSYLSPIIGFPRLKSGDSKAPGPRQISSYLAHSWQYLLNLMVYPSNLRKSMA
jgi:hypothetical protein